MPIAPSNYLDLLVCVDEDWYRKTYSILDGFSAVEHYYTEGWWQLLNPSPEISTTKALLHSLSLAPLVHLCEGRKQKDLRLAGLAYSSFNVSSDFYKSSTESDQLSIELARELLLSGHFSPLEYLEANEDVKKLKINPLYHCAYHGLPEGRPVTRTPEGLPTYFKDEKLRSASEFSRLLKLDRVETFRGKADFSIATGVSNPNKSQNYRSVLESKQKSKQIRDDHFFDEEWVKHKYADLISHYGLSADELLVSKGNQLLLDPSSQFSTAYYLSKYPDVKAANEYALLHFIKHGREEGRTPRLGHGEIIDHPAPSDALTRRAFALASPISPFDGEVKIRRQYPVRGVFGKSEVATSQQEFSIKKISQPVTVIGASSIILQDNDVIESDDVRAALDDPRYDLKGSSVHRASDDSVYLEFKRRSHFGLSTGLNCLNVYDRNYFHFLIEVLPKIVLADELEVPNSIPALITAGLSDNFLKLIELYNASSRPLIEIEPDMAVRVDTLYTIEDTARILDTYNEPMSRDEVKISPAVFDLLNIQRLPPEYSDGYGFAKKLYIRRLGGIRNPSNEKRVEVELSSRGFQSIDPAAMTIEEQIGAFSNATHIVAPTGAALSNLIWCQPETEVIVLKSDHPNINLIFWQEIAASRKLNYRELSGSRTRDVVGEHSVHDNYLIDIEELDRALMQPTEKPKS